MTTRRFPAPWRADKIPGGYVVRDANGQAYIYSLATTRTKHGKRPPHRRQHGTAAAVARQGGLRAGPRSSPTPWTQRKGPEGTENDNWSGGLQPRRKGGSPIALAGGRGCRPESLRRGHRREGPRASEGAPARTARLEELVTDSYMKYFTYG